MDNHQVEVFSPKHTDQGNERANVNHGIPSPAHRQMMDDYALRR
jgi:hypothetical protein